MHPRLFLFIFLCFNSITLTLTLTLSLLLRGVWFSINFTPYYLIAGANANKG